ncbi:hypothetical protein NGA80_10560, partial [Streptococcus suis]|nr:hypothetical protein [Streptococcus suis]MCO0828693.1 hypothetical protein [Streptococcus suis]
TSEEYCQIAILFLRHFRPALVSVDYTTVHSKGGTKVLPLFYGQFISHFISNRHRKRFMV